MFFIPIEFGTDARILSIFDLGNVQRASLP